MMKNIYLVVLSVVALNLSGCSNEENGQQGKLDEMYKPRDGLVPIKPLDFGKTYVPVGQGQGSSDVPVTKNKE